VSDKNSVTKTGRDTNTNSTLDDISKLSAQGIPVFPCGHNKRPLTPDGFKNATTNIEQLTEWWIQVPDAFIGMPTGQITDVTVLDVDPDKGGHLSLRVLEILHGAKLPKTYSVDTINGGTHYYFKDAELKSSASVLGLGLDIRGNGGYVIIPPHRGIRATSTRI
jgi:putative DNA primase/helicase